MINPTVETDLVGEVMEVSYASTYGVQFGGRGRCRAVTSQKDGQLLFWLEIMTDQDANKSSLYYPSSAKGDIICVASDIGQGTPKITLLKNL